VVRNLWGYLFSGAVFGSVLFITVNGLAGQAEDLEKKFERKIVPSGKLTAPVQPKKGSLRYFAHQVGMVFGRELSMDALPAFFVQEEDLRKLGIADAKIKKIASRMKIEQEAFRKKITDFVQNKPKGKFILKVIEMGDVEFLPFSPANKILALKNVSFYYIHFSPDFSQSEISILNAPAVFLLNGEWKFAEVGKIYTQAGGL